MSWLSDRWGNGPSIKGLESSVKGTAHTVGDVLSNPVTQAIAGGLLTATGVGAPLGAAILAGSGALGGALKPGGNLGSALGGAATGALAGGAGALAGKALSGGLSGVPGVQGIENFFGDANGALTKIPGVQGIENLLTGGNPSGTGTSSGGLGGLVQSLSRIFGGGSGGPGGGSGMDKALLLASIAQQADQRQRQQDLQNKGLSYATDAYNAMAPIRSQGMSYLTNNNIPDLSSIFGDPANPFARKVPTPTIGKAVPVINPVAA